MSDNAELAVSDDLAADFGALISGQEQPEIEQHDETQSEPDVTPPDNAAKAEEQPEMDSEGEDEADDTESLDDVEDEADAQGDEVETETKDSEKPDTFDVTLPDGTTEKVGVDELRNGYLRQADYTRKTSELAEQQKQAQAEAEQFGQYQTQLLQALQDKLTSVEPLPLLEFKLKEAMEIGDTDAATELRFQIQDARTLLEKNQRALQYNQSKESQQKEEAEKGTLEAKRQEYREGFAKAMPWVVNSKQGREKFNSAATKAMEKIGITAEEAAANHDHKVAQLAYYAGKYLQSQEAKPQAAQKLKGKAVMPKPGGRSPDGGKSARLQDALRQSDDPNADPVEQVAGLFSSLRSN